LKVKRPLWEHSHRWENIKIDVNKEIGCEEVTWDRIPIQWQAPVNTLMNLWFPNLLIPWCRIFFEKLIVTQLVKQ
jgi:hypothetical protein